MPADTQTGKPRIDLSRYELTVDGQRVKLERQPMELLIFFAQRQGQLVTREEIVEKLWGKDVFVDVDRSINAAVRKIRSALRDDPAEPRFLETVVGKGYRLVGELEVVGAASPAVEPLSGVARQRFKKWRTPLILGFAVLALVSAGIWSVSNWKRESPVAVPIHSIAVLPLANLSGDAAQDYFAQGMTDQLISDLAQISALRVISRTSVMKYSNAHTSVREIGKELNVDAVVEGSVERSGDRVRVSAQLIRASTDTHLWAKTYERDLGDVIALQDEVAGAIAQEVQVQLLPAEKMRLTTSRAIKPEAYESYLKGLYHLSKRNEADLAKSTDCFERAVELEPDYALGYVGLADSYALRGSLLYMSLPPREAMTRSRSAALKALHIDSNLGEGYATLAYIETLNDWEWDKSEQDFRRAIALKPNYAQAHLWYALQLAALGRHRESIAEIERAQQLDPLSLIINSNHGLVLYFAGDYDGALKEFHNVLELDSDFYVAHWQMGLAYEQKQMYAEALEEFAKASRLSPENPAILESIGETYALSGRRKEALQVLRQLTDLSRREIVSNYVMALLYTSLGDKDQAFESLERGYEQRDNYLIFLKVDPGFQSLRSDPRYLALLHKIGLDT